MKWEDAEIMFKVADRVNVKTFGDLNLVKTVFECYNNRELMKVLMTCYCDPANHIL